MGHATPSPRGPHSEQTATFRSSRPFRVEVAQQRIDLARMYRLDHVVVEARLSRLRLVRGEAVAGDGDELHPPAARSGADAPGDLVAIEARQSHVHEGRVRLHSQDELDTGRAV